MRPRKGKISDTPLSLRSFVDAPAMEVLADPRVEYRQANLNMPGERAPSARLCSSSCAHTELFILAAAAAKAFEAGESGAFDIVFDLTGEGILGMGMSLLPVLSIWKLTSRSSRRSHAASTGAHDEASRSASLRSSQGRRQGVRSRHAQLLEVQARRRPDQRVDGPHQAEPAKGPKGVLLVRGGEGRC